MSNLTISNKLISIVVIIVLTYWFGIKGYYVAYNLSFIFMLFVCFHVFHLTFPKNIFSSKKASQLSIHWRYAKPSMFANLLAEMSAYIDILLLGLFIDDMHEIGFYSFALTLTVALRIFPGTVQQITIPYFSSLSNQKTDFLVIFKHYNKILYEVVGVSLIIALFCIPFFTHWLFDGKYDESMPYFKLLAFGWSIRQLIQLQSGAIFGLGKIKYNVYSSLISLIFNLVLFSVALYYYGLLGAAYASVLSGIVILLASRYFFQKAIREIE